MELILGEVQTNARGGKFLPIKGNPMWRSTEPTVVMWEPSAYKDAAGDRVNVCLEATEEAEAAVASWEAAAAKLAASARHVRQASHGGPAAGAIPVLLENVGPGRQVRQAQGHAGQRALLGQRRQVLRGARLPQRAPNRRILAAVQPRQLWVMNQQCGLLELRDVKLDEGVEECPL